MSRRRHQPKARQYSSRGSKARHQSDPVDHHPFELLVDKLSHDGRGIGNFQGKTVFVDGALPGEQVKARLKACHSRYSEAVVQELITTSPDRIEPICKHYSRCGGCNLQHYDLDRQLAFKQSAVLDQLQRWGGLSPQRLLPAIQSSSNNYRHRARFSVWYERDGRISLGFREGGSKQLVEIEQCTVLAASLNSLLTPLHTWVHELKSKRAVAHIELILADSGPAMVIRHTQPFKPEDLATLTELAKSCAAAVWLQPAAKAGLFDLKGEACDPRLHYTLTDFDVCLGYHPQDFIQVNAEVNRQMVSQAVSLLAPNGPEKLLDLFCGIGNFTLPLARLGTEVIGVEAMETMVARGRENATANGLSNINFIAADLEADLSHLLEATAGVDAVLLDPPRAGAKGAMNLLRQLSADRIVYVSCNPATLARDAKELAEMGYTLEALGVMDMFPQTAHVESMGLFSR